MVNERFWIIRVLIENQDKQYSIRQLSKIRKINYKSAYKAIKELQKQGIMNLKKIGNTAICSFNQEFNPLIFAVEYQRREDFLKNKNFRIVYQRLKELEFPFIALLFGSYANNSKTKHSDIDLLIIGERQEEIEHVISSFPPDIHSTIITNKEFIQMARSKEFSVVSEAMKKNIILIGIEEYYRLLKNAGSR